MRATSGVRFVRKGERGWIDPGSPEHSRVISPSKVAAILGEPNDPVSRYESPYRLWHRLKGLVPPEPHKDIFDMGHDIEAYAAARYRRANPGWLLSPDEVQAHVDPAKFGFPAVATVDRRAVRGAARRVVEFKMARNLTDMEAWGDDLKGELPDDYHAQVSALMLFTGWTSEPGHLYVVGPFFNERIYEVAYDRSFAAWIIDKCKRFYDSLAGDEPPELDNTVATYECLRALHPDIDPDATTVLGEAEAVEFVTARAELDDATARFNLARNRLVERMERDKRAEYEGVKIADRRPNSKGSVSFYAAKVRPEDLPTTHREDVNTDD